MDVLNLSYTISHGIYFSEHIARAFAEGIIGLQSISVINNIAIDAIDNIIIRNFFLIFMS